MSAVVVTVMVVVMMMTDHTMKSHPDGFTDEARRCLVFSLRFDVWMRYGNTLEVFFLLSFFQTEFLGESVSPSDVRNSYEY